MAGIDFTTALARLLSDGRSRDSFAEDGAAWLDEFAVHGPDRAALLQLATTDLEFQARVLLHKRFEQVQTWLPVTCQRLGAEAWPCFVAYARDRAPRDACVEAHGFITYVDEYSPQTSSGSEANRLRFVASPRWLHVVVVDDLLVGRISRRAIQILVRWRDGWREFALYVGC